MAEAASGVHAWTQPNGSWGESNAALVLGDGASLLVDTLWDVRLTGRMLAAMRPLTEPAPIATVVNTHSDGDHWWGNELVAGTEIVATDAAARVMADQSPGEYARFATLGAALRAAGRVPLPRSPRAAGRAPLPHSPRAAGRVPATRRLRGDAATIGSFVGDLLAPFEFGEVHLTRPTRTFSGELALEVGGREVHLIEVGPAHTPGDLIVHVPDARTVIAADVLFIGVTPVMWAGPVRNWLAALERLLDCGADTFVPGHGPVCGAREVERLADYWRWLDAAAQRRLAAGAAPPAVARELVLGGEVDAAGFGDWLDPERAVVNVRTIDAHRRGAPGPPGPRDLVAAFARMALLARDRQGAREGQQGRAREGRAPGGAEPA